MPDLLHKLIVSASQQTWMKKEKFKSTISASLKEELWWFDHMTLTNIKEKSLVQLDKTDKQKDREEKRWKTDRQKEL